MDEPKTLDDDEELLPAVRRTVDAAAAPLLLSAWTAPASVFELALKPLEMHQVVSAAPPVTSTSTACRIVRVEGVTRCITVPITDTAEWQEREFQRRAKQRPPRPNKQRFQLKGSSKWAAAAN